MDLTLDFLLDDHSRPDEKEMALAWEEEFNDFGLCYEKCNYEFEKGGLLRA